MVIQTTFTEQNAYLNFICILFGLKKCETQFLRKLIKILENTPPEEIKKKGQKESLVLTKYHRKLLVEATNGNKQIYWNYVYLLRKKRVLLGLHPKVCLNPVFWYNTKIEVSYESTKGELPSGII